MRRRGERRRSSLKAARTPQKKALSKPRQDTPRRVPEQSPQVKQLPSSISESVRKSLFPLLDFDN
jgi:hypothetical protein